MKKILIPTLAVLSLFALVSCGKDGLPTQTTTPGTTTTTQPGTGAAQTGTTTTQAEVKTITEAKFNEVVKNYGFLGQNANITYDFTFSKGPMQLTGYLKAAGNKFEFNYGNGASYLQIRTEGNAIVQDQYSKESTETTYTKSTREFKGYYADFGEFGLVFDRLTFNDFNFDAETNTYALKEAKTLTYEDSATITFSALKFQFVNNVLMNIDVTYTIGSLNVHATFTGKNVGTTTITLPTVTSPQGGDTNPNVITEEKFVELIKDHGFMGQKANATYDFTFTMGSEYSSTGYIKTDAGKFEIDYGYGPFFLQIRTEGNDIVQDDYNKREGETSYRKNTSTFKGYFYNFGELGLSFDQLEFDDFELDSESNIYELKESKSFTYEDDTITFHSIELQFDDNVLVGAEVLFKLNDEESIGHSVFTAKNVGTTTVTLPTVTPAPTDTYEISETDFEALITNAGFIGPQAKATYSYTSRSGERTSEGIVAFDNNKFLIRNQHDIYMHVRTEGNGLVVDSYSSGDGTNWYTSTVPFPGYWTCFASYGLSFKDLTFEDFEFNSSQNRYDLKEAARIALTLGSSEMIINYNELHLQIKNGVLINIEFIADITFSGDPMHVVATYTKASEDITVTLPEIQQEEEWEEITYAQFAAAYEAKEDTPYNKLEMTYADQMGSMVRHSCVATYALDTWTVNEDPDNVGWSDDMMGHMFLSKEELESFSDVPSNVTLKYEKKGDCFKVTMTQIYSPNTENEKIRVSVTEYDKYFAITSMVETENDEEVIYLSCKWSTVENPTVTLVGNSFKILKYEVEDLSATDKNYLDPYIGSIITFTAENTFEFYIPDLMGMGPALAYGIWAENNGKYTYTQKGIIQMGEKHDMPEEIMTTLDIEISKNVVIIKSRLNYPIGSGQDAVIVDKTVSLYAVKTYTQGEKVEYTEDSTLDELIAAFDKKSPLPWNKAVVTWADGSDIDGNGKIIPHDTTYEIVNGEWTLTANPDEVAKRGVDEFFSHFILTEETLRYYATQQDSSTIKVEKKGEQFKMTVTTVNESKPASEDEKPVTSTAVAVVIYDKYFAVTYQKTTFNGVVIQEMSTVWSTTKA